MLTTLILLAAGLPLGAPPATPSAPAAPTAPLHAEDGYAALLAEYEAAETAWRDQLSAAESAKQRKALRDANPAIAFWPRFEALAQAGDGQALWWQATHLREKGVKSSERGEHLRPLLERLIAEHASEPWFDVVPGEILRQRRSVGEDQAAALLARIDEKSTRAETRAEALYALASLIEREGAEGAEARVSALHDRLEKEFPETAAGTRVRAARLAGQTEVGKPAPDFKGTTIDGFEFKLSEYRGKVVMLDFYGFW